MRDGRSGNWRELATPRQREILARLCDPWLAAHGYETDTRLDATEDGRGGLIPRIVEKVRTEQELAKAWLTCLLRCLSLRHPKVARTLKRLLGMAPDRVPARPIEVTGPLHVRVESAEANGAEHGLHATHHAHPDRAPSLPL
jgi:hypothetical protein